MPWEDSSDPVNLRVSPRGLSLFLDHLPTSSCKRSLCSTPYHLVSLALYDYFFKIRKNFSQLLEEGAINKPQCP